MSDELDHSSSGLARHEALLYGSDPALVDAAVSHLTEGAARGEHLVVAFAAAQADLILDGLNDPRGVSVLPNDDTYLTPGAAMEFYLHATRDAVASGATGLRVVGELPAGTEHFPHTWPRWSRYEAVINHVFAELPFDALCAYDTRTTDPRLLAAVRRTHRHLHEDGSRVPSPDYRDPESLLDRWSGPQVLPVERTTPLVEVHGVGTLEDAHRARQELSAALVELDTALQPYAEHLPPADPTLIEVDEYLLAVYEVLTNAIVHGVPPVTVRMWVDHDHVVTTVTDRGDGVDDMFLGFTTRPAADPDAPPHQGLWLARQMCDDLSFRHDTEGFTVRVRADLDVRAP